MAVFSKVRHEMKNHMTNIKGLAARDQYEEIDRYIEKLDATIEELDYKLCNRKCRYRCAYQ